MKTIYVTLRPANLTIEFKKTLVSLFLLVCVVASSSGATKTWTNGGGTNNWSDASNWSTAGVPASGDAVVFNSTYPANCNMNVQIKVASITVSAGYTGIITQMPSDSIVLTGNMSMAGGTFIGGNKRIDINGGLTLTNATFTSTSENLYIQNSFIVNLGGMFNHNNGTIYFDQAGTTTITLASNAATYFYNVVFNSSVGTTITAQDTMVVTGQLSLLQNQIKTGVVRMVPGSSYITTSAFTGGTAVLDVQAPLNIIPQGTAFCGLNLNHANATYTAPASAMAFNGPLNVYLGTFNGGSNAVTMNSTFKQTGGTYNATSGTTTFESTFTFTGGTFNHNNGNAVFTLASTNFTNGGKMSFYDVTINKALATNVLTLAATDTLKAANSISLSMGTINGGNMMLSGAGLTIAANYGGGTTNLLLVGSGTYNIPAGYNIPGMTVNNPSAIVNFTSGVSPVFKGAVILKDGTFNCNATPWNMTQALTISGGTFNSSSDVITYDNAGLIVSTGATFNHRNGTWNFSRTAGAVTITNTLKTSFYDVIINLTNATAASRRFTIATNDTIIALHSLRLQSGYLYTGVAELRGNLIDDGNFAGGTGQLYIANGTGSRSLTFTSATYPVVKINDPSVSITAGATMNFSGTFTLLAGEYFPDAYAHTFTGAYAQSGGTLWNGSGNITHTSPVVISGGDYYPTSGITTFSSTYSQSGGTLRQGSGSITHNSTTALSGGNYSPATGTTTFTGAYTQTGGVFQAGGGVINFNSTLGLTTGTFNPPSGVMTVAGTATITSGTYTAGSARQVFNGSIAINGGNYTASSDTTILAGSQLIIAAVAVFNHNNGTFNFNRSVGTITITNGKKELFNNVIINLTNATASSARFTVTSNDSVVVLSALNLVAGNIYTGGILEARGAVVDGGSFGGGAGTLTIANGTGARTINFRSALLPGLLINEATATVNATVTQATNIGGILALRAGTFNTGAYATTITGAYTQLAGTFTGGAGALTFNSTLGLTAGTFNPSTLSTTVTGAYTQTGGIFSAAAGPVTFNSTFAMSTAGTFNPAAALTTIVGNYTQTAGTTVAMGANKILLKGTVSITGGTFNAPTDTVEFAGSSLYMVANTFLHNNGTMGIANATGNVSFTPPVSFNVNNFYVNLTHATNNILTIAAGDTVIVKTKAAFVSGKINTGLVELKGDVSNVNSFAGGTATFIVSNGTAARTVNLPGTTLGSLTINDVNATVKGPVSGTLALQGNFLFQKGTYTGGAGNVTVAGSYTQTAGTFTGGTGDFSVAGAYTVSGAGAAVTAPSGNLSIGGAITITTPATFAHNNGTLVTTAGVTQILSYTTAGNLVLKNLTVNNIGNAELRPSITSGNLVLTGNLTIGSAAKLNLSTYAKDLTVAGNYTDLNAAGGLIQGSRLLTLNGSAAQTITGSAAMSFYNLVLNNSAASVIVNAPDLAITNQVTLTAGTNVKVTLGNSNFTLKTGATMVGGGSNEFFVTNGIGSLRQENIGSTGRTGNILFPVGVSATKYSPVTLKNTGTNDRFDVNLLSASYANGASGTPLVAYALNKTYNVEEQTPGGSNVTLTLQWSAADQLPGFDRAACSIRHYKGGVWMHEGSVGVANGAGPYTYTAANITTFSPFDVGSGGGSLPVELASFTGNVNGKNLPVLDWVTEIEVNNHFFTLERSVDGENFTELAQVEGSGNSTIEQHYTYVDFEPLAGTAYYRLKQTDYDGQFKYVGNVVALTTKKASTTTVTVAPNPLEGTEVYLALISSEELPLKVSVDIMDISGRNIYHNDLAASTAMTISLPDNLAKGMYFMQMNAGTEVFKQKLIVR